MGRRALPKIDPAIDLSRHLVPLARLLPSFDAAVLWGRSSPLEIEVGSGKGLFLLNASGQRPESNFLGCEVSRKYATFAASKLARAARSNAVVVHGDARVLFHAVLPPAVAAAVHIYFPDPWWKKRHHRRRLLDEAFLTDVRRVLAPGGLLHFWTDVPEYFALTLELIRSLDGFDGPADVPERQATHDLDYQTHFERRMRLHGELVYRALFRRAP